MENSGLWKDNKGDYGNERCIGIIKKNKSNSNVEVRCEHINQLGEKIYETIKIKEIQPYETKIIYILNDKKRRFLNNKKGIIFVNQFFH